MNFDHIQDILELFLKMMLVDLRTKVEFKRLKLGKVMNLLTLKY